MAANARADSLKVGDNNSNSNSNSNNSRNTSSQSTNSTYESKVSELNLTTYYYLECGSKIFTFNKKFLQENKYNPLFLEILSKGPGRTNALCLDADEDAIKIIIREAKNPDVTHWEDLTLTELRLVNKYAKLLGFDEIATMADITMARYQNYKNKLADLADHVLSLNVNNTNSNSGNSSSGNDVNNMDTTQLEKITNCRQVIVDWLAMDCRDPNCQDCLQNKKDDDDNKLFKKGYLEPINVDTDKKSVHIDQKSDKIEPPIQVIGDILLDEPLNSDNDKKGNNNKKKKKKNNNKTNKTNTVDSLP